MIASLLFTAFDYPLFRPLLGTEICYAADFQVDCFMTTCGDIGEGKVVTTMFHYFQQTWQSGKIYRTT